MRTAGIREVRQNLSALLREVREGREIVITDRGVPVARLTPPIDRRSNVPFPDLVGFRKGMPTLDPPLSATVNDDRADRF
jgi:prevent-host-death family protein